MHFSSISERTLVLNRGVSELKSLNIFSDILVLDDSPRRRRQNYPAAKIRITLPCGTNLDIPAINNILRVAAREIYNHLDGEHGGISVIEAQKIAVSRFSGDPNGGPMSSIMMAIETYKVMHPHAAELLGNKNV